MLISIITINYNNASGLKDSIQSVKKQSFKDYEYIIIDGGSNDDSVNAIKENEEHINFWVSEKDNGIYNAINKGINKASGKYLIFLNSGDYFINQHSLEDLYAGNDNKDIVYGNIMHYYNDGRQNIEEFPDAVSFYFLAFDHSLPHQASLIKRDLFLQYGLYDESLKMVSDWKFYLLALFKWNCTYKHINKTITYYNKEGFSSDEKNEHLQKAERNSVLQTEFTNWLLDIDYIVRTKNFLPYYRNSRIINFLKKINLLRIPNV